MYKYYHNISLEIQIIEGNICIEDNNCHWMVILLSLELPHNYAFIFYIFSLTELSIKSSIHFRSL